MYACRFPVVSPHADQGVDVRFATLAISLYGNAAAAPSALTLQWLCRAVLSDTVPLVVSRQLLSAFAQDISQLPDDVHKEAAK